MPAKTEDPRAESYARMFAAAGARERVLFLYSVKIVCGKQTEGNCCCVAGTRPGVYATEVNIHNFNVETARVGRLVIPLISSGAVIGREPRPIDVQTLTTTEMPPLTATMDDCCRIAELLLGATPTGEMPLTVGILAILSNLELSVSAVYTANPLSGEGISIDVEYIPSRSLDLRRQK
jgi:hypothetical protein